MNVNRYYESRKEFNYYKKIIEVLEGLEYESILDVGASRSPILENLGPNVEKVLLDINTIPSLDGIRNIQDNFFTWTPDKHYDIVLCLQVLEHLEDPTTFAQKLFTVARKTVIISVPYRWQKGTCKWHIQDPVTLEKFHKWTGRPPSQQFIVTDCLPRLICVYTI